MENKENQIIYFTEKLNKLRIKEMSFNVSGYETPLYLKRDMRITELALNRLINDTTK